MTTVKVAAAQIRPVLFSLDGSFRGFSMPWQKPRLRGSADCFPETFLPYYPYFSFVEPPVLMGRSHLALYEQAVVVPGPVTEAVGAARDSTACRFSLVSMNGTAGRSTTRSCCSTATVSLF